MAAGIVSTTSALGPAGEVKPLLMGSAIGVSILLVPFGVAIAGRGGGKGDADLNLDPRSARSCTPGSGEFGKCLDVDVASG